MSSDTWKLSFGFDIRKLRQLRFVTVVYFLTFLIGNFYIGFDRVVMVKPNAQGRNHFS